MAHATIHIDKLHSDRKTNFAGIKLMAAGPDMVAIGEPINILDVLSTLETMDRQIM